MTDAGNDAGDLAQEAQRELDGQRDRLAEPSEGDSTLHDDGDGTHWAEPWFDPHGVECSYGCPDEAHLPEPSEGDSGAESPEPSEGDSGAESPGREVDGATSLAVEPGSQDTEALIERAEAHLQQCGYHDAGLPMGCTCPPGDIRNVLLDVLTALAAARADAASQRLVWQRAEVENAALRADVDRESASHMETAAMFRRVRDQRDALRADVDRLTARVRLEADVNDRLATWQEQAEADLAVLRGQRDAALASGARDG